MTNRVRPRLPRAGRGLRRLNDRLLAGAASFVLTASLAHAQTGQPLVLSTWRDQLADSQTAQLPAASPAPSFRRSGPKWQPWVELEAKPGSDRHIFTGSLYVPLLQQDDRLIFANVRGRVDDDNAEGNFGLGYRQMLPGIGLAPEGYILGGYGYADVIRTEADNTFWQATLGVEALTEDWDLRANGYIPAGDEELTGQGSVLLDPASQRVFVLAEQERALWGADAEVGYRLPFFRANPDFEVRTYLGGYYFDAEGYDEVAGPRGRVEARLFDLPVLGEGSRLTVGGEVQWDDPRGTQGFGLARLRIPLNGFTGRAPALTGLDRRMVESVQRDVDVVTLSRAGDREPAVVVETEVTVDRFFLVAEGDRGNGATIATAEEFDAIPALPANSLIIPVGDFGTISTAGVATQAGQTIVGGGGTLSFRGANTGVLATFGAPGQAAVVDGTDAGNDIFTLASGVTLDTLTITGGPDRSAEDGVDGNPGVGNFYLADLSIDRTGDGVDLDGTIGGLIERLRISDVGNSGIEITDSTGLVAQDVVVSDISVAGDEVFGLYVAGGNNNRFSDFAIVNVGTTAANDDVFGVLEVAASGNIFSGFSISGISATGAGSDASGLNASGSDGSTFSDFTIADVSAADGAASGVVLAGSSNDSLSGFSISNVSSVGDSAFGVDLSGASNNSLSGFSIANVSTTGAVALGVFMLYADNNAFSGFSISNVRSTGDETFGLFLYGADNNTFSGFAISNTSSTVDDAYGLFLYDANNNAFSGFSIVGVSGLLDAHGVYVSSSENNTFAGVSISDVSGGDEAFGLYVYFADNSAFTGFSIADVNATASDAFGAFVFVSDDVTLNGFSISNIVAPAGQDGDGVFLFNAGDPGAPFTLNNSTISNVSDDAIDLQNNSAVAGSGNTASPPIGDQLCEDDGSTVGTIGLNGGTCP